MVMVCQYLFLENDSVFCFIQTRNTLTEVPFFTLALDVNKHYYAVVVPSYLAVQFEYMHIAIFRFK